MTNIRVNFDDIVGKIKPMHAVGQPPILGLNFSYIQYMKEANIPYARLHDVGGMYGGCRYVDIPNIFRNFDADENDEASYDFAFTDILIEELIKNDCEPIFRLGVTIENAAEVKAYRIYPPKDNAKWARICEHIIRHYNEGWADGFRYNIKHWEIWNEPDVTPEIETNTMWKGTPEEYYAFYDVAAKHLKQCFGDTIMVGGYASSGLYRILAEPQKYDIPPIKKESDFTDAREIHMLNFFFGFLEYIKAHSTPLDFFSWHSYANVEETVVIADFISKKLCEYGYGHAKSFLTEWNNAGGIRNRGTAFASSRAAAMICAMQNTKTDMLNYYDARIGIGAYGLMFSPLDYRPENIYYVFKAFGHLYTLGNQANCECDCEDGFYAVAAVDGDRKAVMMVNASKKDMPIEMELDGKFNAFLVDDKHFLDAVELTTKSFTLKAGEVLLFKNEEL